MVSNNSLGVRAQNLTDLEIKRELCNYNIINFSLKPHATYHRPNPLPPKSIMLYFSSFHMLLLCATTSHFDDIKWNFFPLEECNRRRSPSPGRRLPPGCTLVITGNPPPPKACKHYSIILQSSLCNYACANNVATPCGRGIACDDRCMAGEGGRWSGGGLRCRFHYFNSNNL